VTWVTLDSRMILMIPKNWNGGLPGVDDRTKKSLLLEAPDSH